MDLQGFLPKKVLFRDWEKTLEVSFHAFNGCIKMRLIQKRQKLRLALQSLFMGV